MTRSFDPNSVAVPIGHWIHGEYVEGPTLSSSARLTALPISAARSPMRSWWTEPSKAPTAH